MTELISKKKLRRSLLLTRRALSPSEWRDLSDRICDHLQNAPIFTQARTILAYFSFRQEPDLSPLFRDDHSWGFPRCVDNSLVWHLWTPNDLLQTNAYGILEPDPHAPILSPEQVDLILVPGVACDRQGYRLGYGGGFYDRLLSLPPWQSKPTMGIVFGFGYLSQLPIEPWDLPLDYVCTETGLVNFLSN